MSETRLPWQPLPVDQRADVAALAAYLGIEVFAPRPDAPLGATLRRTVRQTLRGRWPQRYATDSWRVPFDDLLDDAVRPGISVLDVGAGSLPVLAAGARPAGIHYVGFDIDAAELDKAPAGSYDEKLEGDVTVIQPELEDRFDLIVSWLTMEHVHDVPAAFAALRRYQKPGGRFLCYLAGSLSVASVLNRIVPHAVAKVAMRRLVGRDPDTVFRAHYDHCTYDELAEAGAAIWSSTAITPIWAAGWYFQFSDVVRAPYLAYEEWACRRGHHNLAPYYILDAIA